MRTLPWLCFACNSFFTEKLTLKKHVKISTSTNEKTASTEEFLTKNLYIKDLRRLATLINSLWIVQSSPCSQCCSITVQKHCLRCHSARTFRHKRFESLFQLSYWQSKLILISDWKLQVISGSTKWFSASNTKRKQLDLQHYNTYTVKALFPGSRLSKWTALSVPISIVTSFINISMCHECSGKCYIHIGVSGCPS